MTISDFAEDKLINAVWNATTTGFPSADLYIALNNGDPGETGANEISGGSYARQQTDFSASSSGSTHNVGDINFSGMPAVSGDGVVAWSAWSAATGGNCWW